MTIQKRIVLFFVIIILLLMTVILLMWYRLSLQQKLTEAEKQHFESYRLAVQLKGTADQLTRLIRTYSLTGNPHYLEFYKHILNIRSGKEPRPDNYGLLFWDLVDFDREYKPLPGKKIPLSTLLKKAHIQPAELQKLQEAKEYADQLSSIEKEAIHLMDLAAINDDLSNANRLAAQQILHDRRFNRIKRNMMEKINEFFLLIDQRTGSELRKIRKINEEVDLLILMLILLLLTIALGSWLHSRFKIIHPLKELMHWTDRLKEGHFRISNTIDGKDEIAQLARSFSTMAETIHQNLNELNAKAYTDRMTGLVNRTYLEVELERMRLATEFYDIRCNIILIDIDHFKEVNDRYGHDAGDQILREFGSFLRKNVKEPHIVGRWGGEEFQILTKNISSQDAFELAGELLRKLQVWNFPYEKGRLTASFGVAALSGKQSIRDTLIQADRALYRAKEKGRNRVEMEKLES